MLEKLEQRTNIPIHPKILAWCIYKLKRKKEKNNKKRRIMPILNDKSYPNKGGFLS